MANSWGWKLAVRAIANKTTVQEAGIIIIYIYICNI